MSHHNNTCGCGQPQCTVCSQHHEEPKQDIASVPTVPEILSTDYVLIIRDGKLMKTLFQNLKK